MQCKYILNLLAGILCLQLAFAQQEAKRADFFAYGKTMAQRWELEPQYRKGVFWITAYKPVFFSTGRWSSNPNKQPMSENPNYTVPLIIPYNDYEAKFQFSFKTKIARGLLWNHGDLWAAYTQKAHWQLYNEKLSRPFRELNYEPELILNFGTRYKLLGFTGRMLGVIFNHQSNGRSLPWSRSWNRIILQAGFERKDWQVILRPWFRIPDADDENPAIENYYGRGEAVVVWNSGRHQFSSVMTHSLRFDKGGKGSIQLNWVFPVIKNLKGHLQFSHGYGETLMDYNHRQTTAGLGISLVEW